MTHPTHDDGQGTASDSTASGHEPAGQDAAGAPPLPGSTGGPEAPRSETAPSSDAESAQNPWSAPAPSVQEPYEAPPAPGSAQDPYSAPGGPESGQDPYAAPQAPSGSAPQDPFAASREFAASQGTGAPHPLTGDAHGAGYPAPVGAPQQPVGGAGAQGAAGSQGQQVPPFAGSPQGSPGGTQWSETPPPGTKGVYEGALSGQPTTPSDARMWGMIAQLSVVLGHLVSWGFLGFVGPLIVFMLYKDRSRFVRFQAAEALNGAIAVVIIQVVLSVAVGIFGVLTLGIGWALFPAVGVAALVQLIFSIVAAVKAHQGEWWNYPVNIRLFS